MANKMFSNKSVVNLSNFELNENHISLISRGLMFCPTPANPDPVLLKEDMDHFHTRLCQIAFFDNKESNLDYSYSFNSTPTSNTPNTMGSLEPF